MRAGKVGEKIELTSCLLEICFSIIGLKEKLFFSFSKRFLVSFLFPFMLFFKITPKRGNNALPVRKRNNENFLLFFYFSSTLFSPAKLKTLLVKQKELSSSGVTRKKDGV